MIIVVVLFTFETQSILPFLNHSFWDDTATDKGCVGVGEMIWIANSLPDDCFPKGGIIKFSRSFS